MSVKLLTEHHLEFLSLKGGCTGLSESIHVKMPHCWKPHVAEATSSLFLNKMSVKQESTQRTAQQKKDPNQIPYNQQTWEQQQRIAKGSPYEKGQKSRPPGSGGIKFLATSSPLLPLFLKQHNNSHGGFITYAMHHLREIMISNYHTMMKQRKEHN